MTAPLRSVRDVAPLVRGPWHHVGEPPDRKIHAAIARSLFFRAIAKMPIRVQFPDGTVGGAGGRRRAGDDRCTGPTPSTAAWAATG